MKLRFLFSRLKDLVIVRCRDCGKPVNILGFWVGDHRNCMPF